MVIKNKIKFDKQISVLIKRYLGKDIKVSKSENTADCLHYILSGKPSKKAVDTFNGDIEGNLEEFEKKIIITCKKNGLDVEDGGIEYDIMNLSTSSKDSNRTNDFYIYHD